MKIREQFDLYRSIIAGGDSEEVCWWYSGLSSLQVDAYPPIPVLRASAVMTYRAQTISRDRFAIYWREVGCFFDHATGEPPENWINPITGKQTKPPTNFKEGPGIYTVSLEDTSLSVHLEQPHARVENVTLRFENGKRARFTQTEHKTRGFPLADGSLPPADSGFKARTDLHFFAAQATNSASQCSGVYSFELSGLPPWIGLAANAGRMLTCGTITRARPGVAVDRTAWDRLNKLNR